MPTSDTQGAIGSAHLWRSALLGEPKEVELSQGCVECFERGAGPTLVFAHGWLANANLWRNVVEHLAGRFRCVTLDLPLGSHRLAMRPEADLSPSGCGELIAELLATLELHDVTLVGNDSGGAYSQLATARSYSRKRSRGSPPRTGPKRRARHVVAYSPRMRVRERSA